MPTDIPDVGYTDLTLTLNEFKSSWEPFGGSKVSQEFNAGKSDHFTGTLTTTILDAAGIRALRAFSAGVGLYGEIYVPDVDNPTPSTYLDTPNAVSFGDTDWDWGDTDVYPFGDGVLPGSGLVDGAFQTGKSLLTRGWPESTTILRAGEHFLIDDIPQFCVATADVMANSSGVATFNFRPALRASPKSLTKITVINPKMTAYLMTLIEIKTDSLKNGMPVTFAFEEKI